MIADIMVSTSVVNTNGFYPQIGVLTLRMNLYFASVNVNACSHDTPEIKNLGNYDNSHY